MTREEAIKELKESLETLREYDIAHSSRLKQALEMAIRTLENHDIFMKRSYSQGKQDALSQEPCDYTGNEFFNFDAPMVKKSMEQDAISRQTYADWLDWLCRLRSEINSGMDMARVPQSHRDKYIDVLTDVIDVLPSITQKSGKWLLTHLSNMAYCSECDYLFKDIPASMVEQFKYCPNCGAKMESEE